MQRLILEKATRPQSGPALLEIVRHYGRGFGNPSEISVLLECLSAIGLSVGLQCVTYGDSGGNWPWTEDQP